MYRDRRVLFSSHVPQCLEHSSLVLNPSIQISEADVDENKEHGVGVGEDNDDGDVGYVIDGNWWPW